MFGASIRSVMSRKKLLTATPETTVGQAAKLMAKRKMSAVMVVDADGQLIGIFTERDAVHRVIAQHRDPHATRLADVMTPDPKTVAPRETFGYALLQMHERGFRHMPVVEHGRPVGMVSARHALDPDLEEFEAEAQRRKHIRRYAAGPAG
jgi:CBS domain-containing protein